MDKPLPGAGRVRDRFRRPLNSPEFRGARPRKYGRMTADGMLIERDVRVPTRFGFDLYVDVFRAADERAPIPPLIAWTPYGKHDPAPLATLNPGCGLSMELIIENYNSLASGKSGHRLLCSRGHPYRKTRRRPPQEKSSRDRQTRQQG